MDITKKPYEISLWDDQLFCYRRKLEKVKDGEVNESSYVPGRYYSLHDGNYGLSQAPYVLNNKAYNPETDYYKLADM
jgi:hypothetical protein